MNVETKETYQNSGYRAKMNITITNHKETSVEVEININNTYGDNLSINWTGDSQLLKSSATEYKASIKTIGPN